MEYAIHKGGGLAHGTKRLVGVSAIRYDDRMAEAFTQGVERGGGKWWPKLDALTKGEKDLIRRIVAERITYDCVQAARRRGTI